MAIIRYTAEIRNDTTAWQLSAAVSPFLTLRSRLLEKLSISKIALAATQRLKDEHGKFWSHLSLGETYLDQEKIDDAEQHLHHALKIAQKGNDQWSQGQVRGDLGIFELRRGNFKTAITHFHDALEPLRKAEDLRGEGVTLVQLATALQGQQMFSDALDRAFQGLNIFRDTNNRWNEAFTLEIIGAIYLDSQNYDLSIDYLQQAIVAYRDISDHHGIADTLNHLGEAFLRTGRPDNADASWTEALQIFDSLGSPWSTRIRARLDALGDDPR